MYFSILATIALSAVTSIAVPTPAVVDHVLHERRSLSSAWIKRDRVHPDVKLPMRIGLTQSNLDKGYDYLMEVYV